MMSSHDPNPIFFNNKKIKTGRPEYSLTPPPSTSDNISFCFTPSGVLYYYGQSVVPCFKSKINIG